MDLIAALDSAQVGKAIVASFAYFPGAPDAVPDSTRDEYTRVRAENDWVAAQVAQYPNRLVGFCAVNPLREYALREIARCKTVGLRGLKISVLALASGNHAVILKALQQGGLSPSDVELIELGVGDVNAAIANNAIDIGVQIEPLATIGDERGLFRIWKRFEEIYPEHNTSVIMYSPQFATEQPQAAREFMVAYLRGIRDLADAFDKGRDRAAIIDILTRRTNVKEAAVWERIAPPSVNPDGYVIVRTLAEDQDMFAEMGAVPTKVDIGRVVDHSFVDYAIARLGPYQR